MQQLHTVRAVHRYIIVVISNSTQVSSYWFVTKAGGATGWWGGCNGGVRSYDSNSQREWGCSRWKWFGGEPGKRDLDLSMYYKHTHMNVPMYMHTYIYCLVCWSLFQTSVKGFWLGLSEPRAISGGDHALTNYFVF